MVSRVRIADRSPLADVAKLADALDLGSSGKPWGFKSSHPHQENYNPSGLFFFVRITGVRFFAPMFFQTLYLNVTFAFEYKYSSLTNLSLRDCTKFSYPHQMRTRLNLSSFCLSAKSVYTLLDTKNKDLISNN